MVSYNPPNTDQSQLRISRRLARQPHGGLQLRGGRVRGPGAGPDLRRKHRAENQNGVT